MEEFIGFIMGEIMDSKTGEVFAICYEIKDAIEKLEMFQAMYPSRDIVLSYYF